MAIGYGVDQPRTTYSDTNLAKKVISEAIDIIRLAGTPFLERFPPGSAEDKFKIQSGQGGTTIYWQEDDLKKRVGVLAASAASDATSLTATDGSLYQVGSVIKIDLEYMWVSAISTQTLTVTRNTGGTQATHDTAAVITIVTNARLEGATTTFGPTTSVDQPYNYTQIVQDAVKVTRTQMKLLQYGVANELARQRDKKLLELWQDLEQALILEPVDLRAAGTAATPRIMGGLGAFITTAGNYTTTTGEITKAIIDDAAKDCFIDGGNPRILMAHPTTIQNVRDLLDSSSFVTVDQDETKLGMRLTGVRGQYNDLELVPNRFVNAMYAWLLDPDYIGVYEYDPFGELDIPQTGDFVGRDIVGEFSLAVGHGDKAHGRIYTTSTDGL